MTYTDKHIDCAEAAGLLALYRYGELDADETRRLETHLSGCASCRAELDAITRTLSLVSAEMPSRADAEAAKSGVMRRIQGARRSPLVRFAPAFAATAFAVIAALVLNYSGLLRPHAAPPVAPQQALVHTTGKAPVKVDRDLLENYDLASNMDLLEDMDTLEHMKDL